MSDNQNVVTIRPIDMRTGRAAYRRGWVTREQLREALLELQLRAGSGADLGQLLDDFGFLERGRWEELKLELATAKGPGRTRRVDPEVRELKDSLFGSGATPSWPSPPPPSPPPLRPVSARKEILPRPTDSSPSSRERHLKARLPRSPRPRRRFPWNPIWLVLALCSIGYAASQAPRLSEDFVSMPLGAFLVYPLHHMQAARPEMLALLAFAGAALLIAATWRSTERDLVAWAPLLVGELLAFALAYASGALWRADETRIFLQGSAVDGPWPLEIWAGPAFLALGLLFLLLPYPGWSERARAYRVAAWLLLLLALPLGLVAALGSAPDGAAGPAAWLRRWPETGTPTATLVVGACGLLVFLWAWVHGAFRARSLRARLTDSLLALLALLAVTGAAWHLAGGDRAAFLDRVIGAPALLRESSHRGLPWATLSLVVTIWISVHFLRTRPERPHPRASN